MGPTAMVSLVTYQAVKGYGPQFANLLTLLSGIIQLMMGVFGLGEIDIRIIIITYVGI